MAAGVPFNKRETQVPAHPSVGRLLLAAISLASLPATALAFTVNISQGAPTQVYLQVGVGTFVGGNYNAGGQPGVNPTINTVSVTVPVNQVGDGTPLTMTSNVGATSSFYDGFAMCNAGTVYIGGFYRRPNSANQDAQLTAAPAGPLANSSGDTIPITQISWTTSGNRTGGKPFIQPGSFSVGPQVIAQIDRNDWAEECLSFSYANTLVVPPGTYTTQVTYTLVGPP